MSPKNSLSQEDLARWAKNVLIFSSPALIAFLVALQSGMSLKQASLAIYPALMNAAIDLLKKYKTGPEA